MANKRDIPAEPEVKPAEPSKSAEPEVKAEPSKPELDQEFLKGGRFSNAESPNMRRYKGELPYRPCVYVDSNGKEYPAAVCPLPFNKYGKPKRGPAVTNFAAEAEAIGKLPIEEQGAALDRLQARAQEQVYYFAGPNGTERMVEYAGELYRALEVQREGRGGAKYYIAYADLMVNFGEDGQARWVALSKVVCADAAGTPKAGERVVPHFKVS